MNRLQAAEKRYANLKLLWQKRVKQTEELEAQNAQLRAALEDVEWYYVYDDPKTGHPVMKCPRCKNGLGLGHREDCGTKQALAATQQPTELVIRGHYHKYNE
jgi:hypothetical protein